MAVQCNMGRCECNACRCSGLDARLRTSLWKPCLFYWWSGHILTAPLAPTPMHCACHGASTGGSGDGGNIGHHLQFGCQNHKTDTKQNIQIVPHRWLNARCSLVILGGVWGSWMHTRMKPAHLCKHDIGAPPPYSPYFLSQAPASSFANHAPHVCAFMQLYIYWPL